METIRDRSRLEMRALTHRLAELRDEHKKLRPPVMELKRVFCIQELRELAKARRMVTEAYQIIASVRNGDER